MIICIFHEWTCQVRRRHFGPWPADVAVSVVRHMAKVFKRMEIVEASDDEEEGQT